MALMLSLAALELRLLFAAVHAPGNKHADRFSVILREAFPRALHLPARPRSPRRAPLRLHESSNRFPSSAVVPVARSVPAHPAEASDIPAEPLVEKHTAQDVSSAAPEFCRPYRAPREWARERNRSRFRQSPARPSPHSGP